MKRLVVTAFLLALGASTAFSSGMLIPKGEGMPPLAIKYQRVDVNIRDQVAETRVEQVFTNNTPRQLEATFIFPLPEGASINDFAMMINGKRTSGELVEKDEARKVYEDIVRKMKDPGLLEYMGCNLFKASVFPIPPNGDQKIELRYSEVLPYDSGIVRYLYPLKTGEKASQTQEDFSMAVHISSKESIKSVYSPSHDVGASRPSDHEAVVGFEKDRAILDQDFALYYTVSEESVGINMIPYREEGEDGFFLLLVAPGTDIEEDELIARDITFVLDTSGSMAENDKITQAKNALGQCLQSLPERDRFNIVRFSTSVDTFSKELVAATKENVDKAVRYVDKMDARGGTQIHAALMQALSFEPDKDRPHTIVFLTDGKPTVGITDKDQILEAVREKNQDGRSRLFVFGVGPTVNTHLLDLVSGQNGGVSEYVKPEEEIEEKVSLLYNKMSKPVLADVELTFSNIEVYDLYPQKLSDLFAGLQITLMGRYRETGDSAITLAGTVNGKERSFVYETTFPDKHLDNTFIPRLWATRKVGYLLDEIRLHGEDPELREEVVRLSKEYGIMTPYTSYLVTEDKVQTAMARTQPEISISYSGVSGPVNHMWGSDDSLRVMARTSERREGVPAPAGEFGGWEGDHAGAKARTRLDAALTTGNEGALGGRDAGTVYLHALKDEAAEPGYSLSYNWDEASVEEESGETAVLFAKRVREFKEAEGFESHVQGVRHLEGRTFLKIGSTWIDQEYLDAKDPKVVEIKYASDAYFALIRAEKKMAKYLALGESVVLKFGNVFLKVGEDGKETLTQTEIEAFLKG
jgi:Ca-activated chloride channel family protein